MTDLQGDNTIKLGKILDYVPLDLYTNHSRAVFMTDDGLLKELDISIHDISYTATDDGARVEAISVLLTDPALSTYWITIDIKASKHPTENSYYEYIMASLTTWANNGYIPLISFFNNGAPGICEKKAEVYIAGKKFENVYTNYPSGIDFVTGYDELYYTAGQGVVGFNDENGVVWALKEYK